MIEPFVVLFQGRSGSTWLIETLNTHPAIVARGEVFIALKDIGADAQEEWVRQYFGRARPSRQAVGFKTKLEDIHNQSSMAEVFQTASCRIIHLKRRNVIKQAISWIRGDALHAATGNYNLRHSSHRLPPMPIDPDDVILRAQAIERGKVRLDQFVTTLGLPVCCIYYEELLLDERTQFRAVQKYLGVEHSELTCLTFKNTADQLRIDVTNLDELRIRLIGTDYEHMCT